MGYVGEGLLASAERNPYPPPSREVVEPKVKPEGVIYPLFAQIRVIRTITPLVRRLADTPLQGRVVEHSLLARLVSVGQEKEGN